MNRDDIIRMAREVRADRDEGVWLGVWLLTPDDLERFAALVAAAEREACAKVCEDTRQEYEPYTGHPVSLNYACAAAIRARSEV